MKSKTLAILNIFYLLSLTCSLSLKTKTNVSIKSKSSNSLKSMLKNKMKCRDDCDDELETIPIMPNPTLPDTPTLTFGTPNFTWFRTGYADGANEDDTRKNYNDLSSFEFINKNIHSDQSNGFCTRENIDFSEFNNQITCNGGSQNTHFAIIFKLCALNGDRLSIRTYNDYGMGGILIVDGKQVLRHNHDMWWGMDYNNVSFQYDMTSDITGFHTFQQYGVEMCCGGSQKIQYSRNGGEYRDYRVSEVEDYCNTIGVRVSGDLSPVTNPTIN